MVVIARAELAFPGRRRKAAGFPRVLKDERNSMGTKSFLAGLRRPRIGGNARPFQTINGDKPLILAVRMSCSEGLS